ncbi:GNAT family N-acetyltransferase [Bacillus sp. DX1.1]|uniref:GNAT family N-acetyltransferase n=1 Tax=unclassified Bacillus (in: firmicutes) TaxID=185979 RepID=UPI002570A258|nr:MULTISPECIES: GNAT family N-acetyltransferase [unclassified Bacillus (in: firmicutes)]MDM5155385.1 GNAT family N-acetyltransferase [Bacillus sp. DX1.1]WJE79700.1 GNAT family N-acetyltransferase [Bacillus sp. DX3.1]
MNPLLIEIPSNLDTESLLLRMPKPGDGEKVNAAIQASINELQPWLPFAQIIPTVTDTEINLRSAHIQFLNRDSLRFLIFLKGSEEFIGTCSLHNIDWAKPQFEVGYWIDTRFSGNGYMTEAIHELTHFAMVDLKARRLEIRCESTNTKSRTIPEKLGYELEGILRNEDFSADGKRLTDTCIYAKIQ